MLKDREISIKELCKLSGLSRSTIYRYVRKGIISNPLMKGFRKIYFTEDHLTQLKQIKFLRKKERFQLSEIDDFFLALRNVKGETGDKKTLPSDRSDESSNENKKKIIEIAAQLFSEKGFHNTKIADITNKIGIGKGTFYLYFKDKRELFLECIGQLTLIIIPKERWDEIRREYDPIQRLSKRFRAFLEAFPNFIGVFSFVKSALFSSDEFLSKKAKEALRLLNIPAAKDINWAIQHGIFRNVDAELYAYFFLGLLEMFGYRMIIDSKYTIDDGVREATDLARKIFLKEDCKR